MHTLACNLVHCVFSTKDRANLIPEPERLRQYLTGIARAKNIPLLAAGGTRNHLHVLLALPPAVPLAKAVQDLKGNSSRWLNQNSNRFAWQRGYGAFSVSESSPDKVCRARGTQIFMTHPTPALKAGAITLRRAGRDWDSASSGQGIRSGLPSSTS